MLAITKNNVLLVVRKDKEENKFYTLDGEVVSIKDIIVSDETRLTGIDKEITLYQCLKEKNNLFLVGEMIKSIQNYKNTHCCYGNHGFQVNVKYHNLLCVDIAEELFSNEEIQSIVEEYTSSMITLCKTYAMSLNKNIIEVGLAGKSDGWLEIATTIPVCTDLDLEEKITQCSEHDICIGEEYKSVELDLLFIAYLLPYIQKKKTEFENTLSSDEFWIQERYSRDLEKIKEVRKNHSKLQKISNGMEAWITYALWGYGVRFYPVGSGYDGMFENTSDGMIRLVEKL